MGSSEYELLPRTRNKAKDLGEIKYFSGEPCSKGHLAPRYASTNQCIDCLAIWTADWRARNPGRVQETSESWRQENREHVNELARIRYAETEEGERVRERSRDWRRRNPDAVRNQTRLRRARKLGNGGTHTVADINDLKKIQRHKCAFCGTSIRRKFEVDHIVPLSKGGRNDRANLQLLCQPCNRSKHAHDPIEWAQRKGKLL